VEGVVELLAHLPLEQPLAVVADAALAHRLTPRRDSV
jgi:hypothetical protein